MPQLTQQQQEAIQAIKQTSAPLSQAVNEARNALNAAIYTDKPDTADIKAKAEELAAAELALAQARAEAFAKLQAQFLRHAIAWAAETQVAHWMTVLDGWKKELGGSFDNAYAASNTIYVARQNNVLFSVLAQFFGKEGMNTRLFLFETPEFVTTPKQMLDVLIRTVSDRSVGQVFFGNYYLMDYELMGGDARQAIQVEDKKYGIPVFLPKGRCRVVLNGADQFVGKLFRRQISYF